MEHDMELGIRILQVDLASIWGSRDGTAQVHMLPVCRKPIGRKPGTHGFPYYPPYHPP